MTEHRDYANAARLDCICIVRGETHKLELCLELIRLECPPLERHRLIMRTAKRCVCRCNDCTIEVSGESRMERLALPLPDA